MTLHTLHLNRQQLFAWGDALLPPGTLRVYISLVATLGATALVYALSQTPFDQLPILVMLFILIYTTEWATIRLTGTPLQGASLSVSSAIAFAALLMLGPAACIIVNTGSACAFWLKEKRPFYKRLFTSSTYVLSSAVSGLVYVVIAQQPRLTWDLASFIAAGLAAGAYFLSNSTLISAAISLQTGRPFRSVLANWQWLFLQFLTSLAIGLVMAMVYLSGRGINGFILSGLLLVLPWYSIYFYVQKSRQVAVQTEKLKVANQELAQANRALDLQVGSLRALHNVGISLNSTQSLESILNQILASVVELIRADTCAIFLDQNGQRLTIAGHIGLSAQYVSAPEMALNGSANRALRENRALVMDKNHNYPAMLSSAAEREGIRAAASLPLNVAGDIVGALDVCFKTERVFADEEIRVLKALAEQAAVALQNARLVEHIHDSYLGTIRALAATVEAKDPYTRGHSDLVRQLAVAIGHQLGLGARQIEFLNLGALFHDLGKIGISEAILNKPGGLTPEEWTEMRRHPIIGERILLKVPALAEVLPIVRHHHERFDGKGYPDGISSRECIPAAIIAVCDSYQAMTSDRPYRAALSHSAAIEEIRAGSGTQFVPQVVEAFFAAVEYQDIRQLTGHRFNPALLLRNPSHPAILTVED
ncbi:MAG: GAF domain-containing protein [Chloroflexi bacterium]|nr:GAF domain-containing protein [Chloroflexota bacterium]